MSSAAAPWTVVLPVKGGPGAKSRLGGPPALAEALALDTLAAVTACRTVRTAVVVTADDEVARRAAALGAVVRREQVPGAGLDRAVADGLAGTVGPVAVLLADLPALRPQDLDAVLREAGVALGDGAAWVVVPDAEGSGSVLLAGRDAGSLRPAFGPGSAAAHAALGAARLDVDAPRLRGDVDTATDLHRAVRLGVGPRTTAALASLDACLRTG